MPAINVIVATGSSTRVAEDARVGVPGRTARKPYVKGGVKRRTASLSNAARSVDTRGRGSGCISTMLITMTRDSWRRWCWWSTTLRYTVVTSGAVGWVARPSEARCSASTTAVSHRRPRWSGYWIREFASLPSEAKPAAYGP